MKSRIVTTTCVVAAFWFVFMFYGCQADRAVYTRTFEKDTNLKKVAVLPYYVVKPPMGEVMVRSPLSNDMFRTGPVDPDAEQIMTGLLREQLAGKQGYTYVTRDEVPDFVRDALTRETVSFEAAQRPKLGQQFDADGVLMGFIYAFKDRKGTAYSVESPASVTFDLYLLDAGTGAILWKGNYSRTQQAVSDNLLDLSEYKSGLRWMKASDLALYGMKTMFKTFPGTEGLK